MSERGENINGDLITGATPADHEVATSSVIPVTQAFDSFDSLHHQNHPSHPQTKDNEEIWSSPWVNVMMVLFAILFMMISQQSQQASTPTPQDDTTKIPASVTIKQSDINNHITKLSDDSGLVGGDIDEKTMLLMPALLTEIKQYIAFIGTDKIKASLLLDYSLKVSLSASILFDSDSTEMSEQARLFLDKLSTSLKKNSKQIHVIGHTDDQAIDKKQFTDKWQLSLMRATAVTRYMITQGQVEPYKFTIMGRSEYEPLTANLNDEARAINRRVDIIITTNASRSLENRL